MANILIAMMGLPRSGKSTIVARIMKAIGAPVVRRDAIRLALHGERYATPAEPMVKAMSLYMIRSLFLAGHEVVICDETNFSRAARSSLKDPLWEVKWYPVLTDLETCKERAIATDQADLVEVQQEMFDRYEPLEVGEPYIVNVYHNGDIASGFIGPQHNMEIPRAKG